jgi:hypothetical protein
MFVEARARQSIPKFGAGKHSSHLASRQELWDAEFEGFREGAVLVLVLGWLFPHMIQISLRAGAVVTMFDRKKLTAQLRNTNNSN